MPTEAQKRSAKDTKVTIESQGWKLIGDLLVPRSSKPIPAVLMLNRAGGNRKAYEKLAKDLAQRGIASLRLDLRGHGESINLGKSIPSEEGALELIKDSNEDVNAAHQYLRALNGIRSDQIAIVGASYSGEKMMEAARKYGFAQAYVALSPGSFSDESMLSIDPTQIPWLYIAAKNERYLKEVTTAVSEMSQMVETLIIPGTAHATGILDTRRYCRVHCHLVGNKTGIKIK
ncbi:MAG: alpha/beta fold hydrolase [Saprospiraceae bacterium]|nr:alpha/beta fold hydrolase [Saprospiraceae bacterium]